MVMRSFQRTTVLLLLIHGFVVAGLACEPAATTVRHPQCAKHPPPPIGGISVRLLGPYYYDSTSARCVQYVDPAPLDLEASGYGTWAEYYDRYVPFESFEECAARCYEPQPCDADNPCPSFEYPCSGDECPMYPQICVDTSSEGTGYCTLQCQAPGTVRHFGWSLEESCPDGFSCTEEACVLPE